MDCTDRKASQLWNAQDKKSTERSFLLHPHFCHQLLLIDSRKCSWSLSIAASPTARIRFHSPSFLPGSGQPGPDPWAITTWEGLACDMELTVSCLLPSFKVPWLPSGKNQLQSLAIAICTPPNLIDRWSSPHPPTSL